MSFLTEYFDNYREHKIRKISPFFPERRFVHLEGKWLDPKKGTDDKQLTDKEIKAFITKTMMELRGQSTYYNSYCAHWPEEFKGPFQPRPKKKKRPCKPVVEEKKDQEAEEVLPKPLALKDTEVMKKAAELYGRDMDALTLQPLNTTGRIYGYVRPCLYRTGLSEYSESIGRLAYETVRDDRTPKFYAHNGFRPKWGYPPEGTRQPMLDGAPYEGERLM